MTHADGMTVAILETDAVLCLSLDMAFEAWGMWLLSGGSVAALLRTVQRSGRQPDVLVADLVHGRETGFPDAVDQIQATLGRPVPVVVTTGNRTRKEASALLARGWLLLEKPYAPETLRTLVQSLAESPGHGGASGRP
ncbi:hypothetical protein [Azospirillum oleiclasticum]|uniref:Response regulatory domain-containing protein n=1 Tax=Azospirillum oleiclasticum TaxID=2735135 RepID=A0ABX2TCM7_9PROT|nr:hypothetical protein [Azospirillum oleiclasticum]NYZ21550.1 hypothetical protein [Azospirillum oleiclasticum]